MNSDLKEALLWITSLLKKHEIPFVLSGGLAAHAYGSTRIVRDIDLDIANDGFEKLEIDVQPHIVFGPEIHTSKALKNLLMQLKYHNIQIDIAGAENAQIFDNGLWKPDRTNLSNYEIKSIFGIEVPVMNPSDFIVYKSKSPRPEDLKDIVAVREYMELNHSAL